MTPVPITGTSFGFDFNPTVDRIRVVNNAGQNFRMNPNTGAFVDGDLGGAVAAPGLNMDGAINGATTTVDAAAYTNNQQNATVTTLYTLDAASNQLFIQNPPNAGTQSVPRRSTLGGSALDFTAASGFDILPGVNVTTSNDVATGTGLAALTVSGVTSLYTIDLTTGVAALVAPIGDGSVSVQGLATQGEAVPGGIPAIALSADGTQLLRFNTGSAATAMPVTVSGIVPNDVLIGIDWRPQTGQLFGFGADDGANNGTLYLLDPQTGAATAVGTPGQVAFVDGAATPIDIPAITVGWGFDFNPTVDRVRVVTNTGLNFRINPNTGAPVDGDLGGMAGSVAGINPDGPINGLPGGSTGVSAAAYTNSFGQALVGGVTTQYTLDPTSNTLSIQNPPNSGTQTMGVAVSLDGAPLDFTSVNGFDIPGRVQVTTSASPATGLALAVLTVGSATNLYTIELSTGVVTLIGPVGGGGGLAGLAVGEPGVTPSGLLTISKSGAGVGSVTSSPVGIACGGRCAFLFSTEGTITLTALPAPGSVFTGWTGAGCSGTGPCIADLSGDTGVTANFDLVAPPVLGLVASGTTVRVGDFVSVTLTFSSPGPAGDGDLYFAVVPPAALGPSLGCAAGDAAIFFDAGFTPVQSCLSSAPSTFAPLAVNLTIPAGVSPVTFPGFFAFVVPPGTPPGNYVFVVVLTALGAFNGPTGSMAASPVWVWS